MFHNKLIHAPELGAAAGQDNSVLGNVRHKFGGCLLQHRQNRLDDLTGGTAKGFHHIRGSHHNLPGQTGLEVSALDQSFHRLSPLIDGAHADLCILSNGLSHNQAVFLPQIADNCLVKIIAGHLDRGGVGKAVHGQHADVRGTAADIHHHMALGTLKGQICAEGGSQRLLDQIDPASAGFLGDLHHSSLFNAGNPAGYGNDHPWLDKGAFENLVKKLRQHPFGQLVIRDDTLPQRVHGHHVAWGSAQHISCGGADLQNLASVFIHRHHRRLPQHDSLALSIYDNICIPQVNAQVLGKN